MKNELQATFEGKQNDMYTVANRLWNLYQQQQPDFARLNLMYTKEYGESAVDAIAKAQSLPDAKVRRAAHKNIRALMMPAGDDCLDSFLQLMSGIEKVFPPIQWETQKQLAGWASYSDAAKPNWSFINAIMLSGSAYLDDNLNILLNNGQGISPDFQQEFTDRQATFAKLYTQFGNATHSASLQTTEKGMANNAVYATLTSMLNDAKIIYNRNLRMKEMFSYTKTLKQVAGVGKTGYNFKLLVDETLQPVTEATVSFIPTGNSYTANSKGMVITDIPAGKYTVTITAPGFVTVTKIITVTAGTTHRKKFVLKKAAATDNTVTNKK